MKTKKVKHYHAAYLCAAIIGLLLVEGLLISGTGSRDWQTTAELFDATGSITQITEDVTTTIQPMTDLVQDVNKFYQLSADVMMQLLDLSENHPMQQLSLLLDGVNDFYQEASVQMAGVLDMSSASSWPAAVAGVSIEVSR